MTNTITLSDKSLIDLLELLSRNKDSLTSTLSRDIFTQLNGEKIKKIRDSQEVTPDLEYDLYEPVTLGNHVDAFFVEKVKATSKEKDGQKSGSIAKVVRFDTGETVCD